MNAPPDIHRIISSLKSEGEPFAVATVVRTVSVTAAKAGAKAVIDKSGNITDGWVGGGCARSAVVKAALRALENGEPCLVSLLPEELVKDTEETQGVNIAANMCPSKGTMDIFVEPVLPPCGLLILGNSPVAIALEEIASRFGFACTCMTDYESLPETPSTASGYIVISTQGNGDAKALDAALSRENDYIAFVGSRKKVDTIRTKLVHDGLDEELFDKLKAPAGLDIGAITPDEIALSIVAEMIKIRRRGQREN